MLITWMRETLPIWLRENPLVSPKKWRCSRAVMLSIILHVLIITFLCLRFAPNVLQLSTNATSNHHSMDNTPIIQASTFNQAQIEAEVTRLQVQKRAKEQAVIDKENKLTQALNTALTKNKQNALEIQTLKQDKAALARLKEQQKIQAKALAEAEAKANAAKVIAEQAKKEAKAREEALLQQAEARKQAEAKANALAKAQSESDLKIKTAEMEKQQAQQQAKAATEAKAQAELDAQKATEAIRIAKQKADTEQAALAAQKAKHDQVVNQYALQIRNAIERNWLYPKNTDKVKCLIALSLAPTGQVLDASLVQSSGDDNIDRLAIAAVYKSSPLPVPTDPDDFAPFRQINLTVWTHDDMA